MRDAATVGHTEWKRENDAPKKVARGRACGRCAKPLAETRRTGVRFLSYRTWFWSASWSWNVMEDYFLVLRTRKIHPKFRTANRIIVSINRGMIRDQKEIRLMNVLNKCALLSSIKCRGELYEGSFSAKSWSQTIHNIRSQKSACRLKSMIPTARSDSLKIYPSWLSFSAHSPANQIHAGASS